ncbi:MAG: glycosyltransferase [Gemmatimonadaceae bacterium]
MTEVAAGQTPDGVTRRSRSIEEDAALARMLFGQDAGKQVDMLRDTLEAPLRPEAELCALDTTEFFGDTTGGVRTYLLQKARYVESSRALRQVIVIPGPEDRIANSRAVRCYRLQGRPVPTQAPYRFMSSRRSNGRIIAHERPDVIEVGSPGLAPWLTRPFAKRLGIPMVCFFHSDFPNIIAPRRLQTRWWNAARSVALSYLKLLDQLFAVTMVASDYSASALARAGVDNTVRVPLGVDLELFDPRRREYVRETRVRAGLPAGPLAGYTGRFAREKDLDVLVDAWTIVERETDASLVLIGDGPLRAELQARARSKRIHWLPFERDRNLLADLVASLDFYVAPGPAETFGLAGLEALACGVPVLSCDSGGVGELVTRSGAGKLFEAGVPASLANGVRAMLTEDLVKLGLQGRAYAEREHSWTVAFDRIFAVYLRVIAE